MSNETKRDVLKEALRYVPTGYEYDWAEGKEAGNLAEQLLARYAAALPDDLPVIPKAAGDVLVKLKHKKLPLSIAMSYTDLASLPSWMTFKHEEDFALAWVLGVWRVEETGEIVKLEEEK